MFKAAFVAAMCLSSVSAYPHRKLGHRERDSREEDGPCGADQQPVCKGRQMRGRESECDFGAVASGFGICIDVMAHTSPEYTGDSHSDDHSNSGDILPIDDFGYDYSEHGDEELEAADEELETADEEELETADEELEATDDDELEATDEELETADEEELEAADEELETADEEELETTEPDVVEDEVVEDEVVEDEVVEDEVVEDEVVEDEVVEDEVVEDEVVEDEVVEDEVVLDEEPAPATCGTLDLPVCSGDDMIGRMYECDFGYHGYDGICIKYEDYVELTEDKASEEEPADDVDMLPTTHHEAGKDGMHAKKGHTKGQKGHTKGHKKNVKKGSTPAPVKDEEPTEELPEEEPAVDEVPEVVEDVEDTETVDEEPVEDIEPVEEEPIEEDLEAVIEDAAMEEDTEVDAEDVAEDYGSTLDQSTDDCDDSGDEFTSCAIARAVAGPDETDTFELEQGDANAEAEATFTGPMDN